MTAPKRIQRKRARGWRMPENTVYVGRPTKWGNPFRVGDTYFVMDMAAYMKDQPLYRAKWHRMTAADAVDCYQHWIGLEVGRSGYTLAVEARAQLAGRDLACWCPLDEPCHADVLLGIANEVA